MRKFSQCCKQTDTHSGVFLQTLFPLGLIMVMIGAEAIGTGSFLQGVGTSIFGFCMMTLVIRKMNVN